MDNGVVDQAQKRKRAAELAMTFRVFGNISDTDALKQWELLSTNPNMSSQDMKAIRDVQAAIRIKHTRHPLSIDESNKNFLLEHTYMVAEKTNGYMLQIYFLPGAGIFFSNRKGKYRKLKYQGAAGDMECKLTYNLILEAEIVESSDKQVEFWIYDCIFMADRQIYAEPLSYRLECALRALIQIQSSDNYAEYKARFFLKEFYSLSEYNKLLSKMEPSGVCAYDQRIRVAMNNNHHPTDGVIFTSETFGLPILKHKPRETIDFLYQSREDPDADLRHILLLLDDHGKLCPFRDPEIGKNARLVATNEKFNGCVLECFHVGNNRWQFARLREDKKNPNRLSTAQRIRMLIKRHMYSGENSSILNAFAKKNAPTCLLFDDEKLCTRLGLT